MRSLANLLEAAVGRSATEVVLESGQPIVFTTTRGPEVEQSVLPQTDLFDMIIAAVDDAQQVELAVGNPVRFTIDAGASWTVTAEPGIEGMLVRAHRPQPAPSLEITLEEPGFALGESSFAVGEARSFEDPFADDDDELASAPAAPPAPAATPARTPSPPSELKDEAFEAPVLQELDRGSGGGGSRAPAAPFEHGTWELADEDDFDVGLDEEDGLPSGFAEPPRSGPSNAATSGSHIGVPDDDDDDGSFDPFGGEPTRSPPPPAVGSHKPAVEPARPRPHGAETPTVREIPAAAARPMAETRRELPAIESPQADTHRELPSVADQGLGTLAMSIAEGAMVYVREPGLGETLAQSFAAPSVVIGDRDDIDEVWTRVGGLPIGTVLIVRREDPSTMLDWILRRLEEGFRVFVETRARTLEGARRILLGVGASERAERWLDGQATFVIEAGEGGPRLRAL